MKFLATTAAVTSLFTFALADYVPTEPWTTLTPDSPIPTNALTNYTGTFGIAPIKITDSSVLASISEASTKTTSTLTSHHSSSSSHKSTKSSSSSAEPSSTDLSKYITQYTKKSSSALQLILNDTTLLDSAGRVGSIVANRQFQFDGPPPQAGAIYAAGWSITDDGVLAIGDNDVFYQCLSGTFYNLYDETLGSHCNAVNLKIIGFTD